MRDLAFGCLCEETERIDYPEFRHLPTRVDAAYCMSTDEC